ncbi:hypothetical protein JZ751_021848 [Albula glossodonta]|uniref:Uncharacterized protein n=1 Tax=Albula glossodonta TaxID=121402 RepID=A0A8T2MXS6_9TELE|nr:hypothetical protein JZ751_021848 [Albula glossodonta]
MASSPLRYSSLQFVLNASPFGGGLQESPADIRVSTLQPRGLGCNAVSVVTHHPLLPACFALLLPLDPGNQSGMEGGWGSL